MEQHNDNYKKIEKAALTYFLGLASVIYATAFVYCFVTQKTLGMSLLGVGVTLVLILVFSLFRK